MATMASVGLSRCWSKSGERGDAGLQLPLLATEGDSDDALDPSNWLLSDIEPPSSTPLSSVASVSVVAADTPESAERAESQALEWDEVHDSEECAFLLLSNALIPAVGVLPV